jgi:hypothetical protein
MGSNNLHVIARAVLARPNQTSHNVRLLPEGSQ